MQKLNKISLAHYHQGVSSSKNEMNMPPFATQIKKNKKKKNLEIQIEYVYLVMVQHVPNSRKRKCMIKHTLNTFTV